MSRLRARRDLPLLAIGLSLAAHVFFSFIDATVKWLVLAGMPALQCVFMRYVGHFLVSYTIVARQDGPIRVFHCAKPKMALLRGAMLGLGTTLNFLAIPHLPLTLTSTILFLSPLMICALSWPILGERVGPWRIGAIIVGFIGILIVVRPFGEAFHPAVLFSIGSVTAYTFYLILTRMLAGVVPSDILQLYTGAVGTFLFLPVMFFVWENPIGWFNWGLMLALGLWGYIGHEMLTRAYELGEASMLAPFGYSFLIYMTLWSTFVFDQPPDFWAIVGTLIVALAGLIIWMRERREMRLRNAAAFAAKGM